MFVSSRRCFSSRTLYLEDLKMAVIHCGFSVRFWDGIFNRLVVGNCGCIFVIRGKVARIEIASYGSLSQDW